MERSSRTENRDHVASRKPERRSPEGRHDLKGMEEQITILQRKARETTGDAGAECFQVAKVARHVPMAPWKLKRQFRLFVTLASAVATAPPAERAISSRRRTAAPTNFANSGCGCIGRLLNSGWNWQPRKC